MKSNETPLGIEKVIHAEKGNVYGKRLTADSILNKDLQRIKGVKNLHVACATIGLPGVATCFKTAEIICEQISGFKIPG